jgi:serine/threonine protein kinase
MSVEIPITVTSAEPIVDTSEVSNIPEKYRSRTVINSKYIFEKKIGSGSFGSVYRGRNIISGDGVAIKFEATMAKIPTLLWESKILNHLAGTLGVVKLRYFGTESNKNIIVMDLFSHTLCEEIQKIKKSVGQEQQQQQQQQQEQSPNCTESQEQINSDQDIPEKGTNSSSEQVKTEGDESSTDNKNTDTIDAVEGDKLDSVIKKPPPYTKEVTGYLIAMLQIISRVHEAGIVHRDIKPENFMISFPTAEQKQKKEVDGEKMLHIIDFGLSKFYMKGDKHVINTHDRSIVGTIRYISKYTHDGDVYSRRDDIISIIYVSIYLLKGTLPWCGLYPKKGDTRTKEELVYDKKVKTTSDELCEGLPALFKKLLDYAYSLEFEEKPDYLYMIRQCKLLMRI